MEACPLAAQQSSITDPQLVVKQEELIPAYDYPAHMATIPPSRMFLIREALNVYRKNNPDSKTYDASQGDGGASLPGVPKELLERALELQLEHGTAYDQPFGTAQFRKAAAENYWHLDPATGWGAENIVFVQGGRDGLNKAYGAMIKLGSGEVGGFVVISAVPWVSYNWGPYGIGLNVMLAPGDPADGWRLTPESIQACADKAKALGRKIAGLIITSPDNPTGRTIPLEEQIALARAAFDAGYPFVLFDWIYHWVTDSGPSDINAILNAFPPEDREKLIFLDGLTKSLGASNIRSAHLVAGKAVVKHIVGDASHGVVPAYFAQAVAIAAYEKGFAQAAAPIIDTIKQSRQVMRDHLSKSGAKYVLGDGYYAFIDCTPYIQAGGLSGSEELLTYLAEKYGIAIVAGIFFSEAAENWIRFSYALPPDVTQGAIERLFEGLNALLDK